MVVSRRNPGSRGRYWRLQSISGKIIGKPGHCYGREADSKPVSPQSLDSWNTLLNAIRIRKYAPMLGLAKDLTDGEIPPVYDYRKCHNIFTINPWKRLSLFSFWASPSVKTSPEQTTYPSWMASKASCRLGIVYHASYLLGGSELLIMTSRPFSVAQWNIALPNVLMPLLLISLSPQNAV